MSAPEAAPATRVRATGPMLVRHAFNLATARAAQELGVMFPAYCGKWIWPANPTPARPNSQAPDRCPLCALVMEGRGRG